MGATRHTLLLLLPLVLGCDMAKFAAGTTSKVLTRGQVAMRMESDYELAAQAIPGSLKTVEAIHTVDPDNENLVALLAEGYCQYAAGFIEDDWEAALVEKKYDRADKIAARATKLYARCMGYSLKLLGPAWEKALTGKDPNAVARLAKAAGPDERHGMLFLGIALGGSINLNKDNVALLAQMGHVRTLFNRILEIDKVSPPKSKVAHALPHLALGRMKSSLPKLLGGKPKQALAHFRRAEKITGGKMLLVPVYMARSYGVSTQRRKFFHKTLVKVLSTDPGIWPEERLSNEIAHRRARRYIAQEKDLF